MKSSQLLLAAKRVVKLLYWRTEEMFSSKWPLYVFGDSHAGYFRFGNTRDALVRVIQITGATAYGLTCDDSVSGAKRTIARLLRRIDRRSVVLFQFGEVDCAFSVWKRVQKNGSTPDQEVHEACQHYLAFLREVRELGFSEILVATVPPPTVSGWGGWQGAAVAAFRQQIDATLSQRTECARTFNQLLRSRSSSGGYRFIDVEADYLDQQSGVVRNELVVANDLHLNWRKARLINLTALARMGMPIHRRES